MLWFDWLIVITIILILALLTFVAFIKTDMFNGIGSISFGVIFLGLLVANYAAWDIKIVD
jgi:hypothetical protein